MIEKVGVKGLNEFSRALKKLDSDLPKGLRIAMNGAADHLIGATRPQIPRRTGSAAASLKAKSTRTAVRIGVGGRIAPYYPWLDFGGEGRAKGRPPKRTFIKEGRYLYPTLRRDRDAFQKIMQDALVGVAEGAGLDVT